MTIAALLMLYAAEKLKPFCGTIRRVTVKHDRILVAFNRTAGHLIILSLGPNVDKALLDEIGSSVRKLELVGEEEET